MIVVFVSILKFFDFFANRNNALCYILYHCIISCIFNWKTKVKISKIQHSTVYTLIVALPQNLAIFLNLGECYKIWKLVNQMSKFFSKFSNWNFNNKLIAQWVNHIPSTTTSEWIIPMLGIIVFPLFAIIFIKCATIHSKFHCRVTGSDTIQVISKLKNICESRGVLQRRGVLVLKYILYIFFY